MERLRQRKRSLPDLQGQRPVGQRPVHLHVQDLSCSFDHLIDFFMVYVGSCRKRRVLTVEIRLSLGSPWKEMNKKATKSSRWNRLFLKVEEQSESEIPISDSRSFQKFPLGIKKSAQVLDRFRKKRSDATTSLASNIWGCLLQKLSHLFHPWEKKTPFGQKKTAGPTVGGNQKSGVKNSWYMVKYYPHYVQA